jgi:hypothetical protein
VQRRIAEDRAPEREVDRIGLGGHRHLDLLHGAAVGGGTLVAGDGRDGPGHRDVLSFGAPHLARELDRQPIGGRRQQGPRLEAGDIGHGGCQPRGLLEAIHLEHGGRTAMEDDPVVDVIGGKEVTPALFAHAGEGRR